MPGKKRIPDIDVVVKDKLVLICMSTDAADAVRACLFREGRNPTSPAVVELRRKLKEVLSGSADGE